MQCPIAIAKLDRLGIGGSLLRWFRSYLTERQLIVAIGDSRSSSFCATSGIPQGSHLGPLIFLIYFNDVHLVLKVPRLSFADDLKLFLRCVSIQLQTAAYFRSRSTVSQSGVKLIVSPLTLKNVHASPSREKSNQCLSTTRYSTRLSDECSVLKIWACCWTRI